MRNSGRGVTLALPSWLVQWRCGFRCCFPLKMKILCTTLTRQRMGNSGRKVIVWFSCFHTVSPFLSYFVLPASLFALACLNHAWFQQSSIGSSSQHYTHPCLGIPFHDLYSHNLFLCKLYSLFGYIIKIYWCFVAVYNVSWFVCMHCFTLVEKPKEFGNLPNMLFSDISCTD